MGTFRPSVCYHLPQRAMEVVQYVILGFAPGLFWVWYLRRKDDLEPEPYHLVLWVFALGCLSTLLVFWLRPILDARVLPSIRDSSLDLADAFLVTAPLEEIAKMLAFLVGIYWHRQLDEPLDGIIYGTAAGLGFASVENVVYLLATEDASVVLIRGFTATLAHVATSGAMGFFLGLSRFRPARWAPWLWLVGLMTAVFFHGIYDYFLFCGGPLALVSLLCLLPLMLVLLGLKIRWARRRSGIFHSQGERVADRGDD